MENRYATNFLLVIVLHGLMAFGEDLRGELFDKLGVDASTDPMKLILQGDEEFEAGNRQKAQKIFEQAIQLAAAKSEKYQQQSQHRAAAEALYVQALGYEKLDQKTKGRELYTSVVDELLAASKNAIAFDENNRGFAGATLAGMVCLLYGDHERALKIYNDHANLAEEKPNTDFLKKLLYSLGYILDALRNDNVAALTDAQNYMSTDLKPMLGTAKLSGFENLLENIVKHTQQELESRITMPNIKISTTAPRDIQFNQMFSFEFEIVNEGDGKARNLEYEIEIPQGIEIVDGNTKESLSSLEASQTVNRSLSLRFLTGDSSGEEIRELKGEVEFVDMLGNSHKQYFGPITLEFTATSQKEEYQSRLSTLLSEFPEDPAEEVFGNIPPIIPTDYRGIIQEMKAQLEDRIENEEFSLVDLGLDFLDLVVTWGSKLTSGNDFSQSVNNEIETMINNAKNVLRNDLEKKHQIEKEQELNVLRTEKEKELRSKLQQVREELAQEKDNAINEIREEHNLELQQIRLSQENKLKQQLVQLENKLKEEFQEEIQEKNTEMEELVREFQEKERQVVTEAKQQTKEEVTARLNAKIKELQESLEEMKRQLTQRHEEEKELELNTLRQKLENEKRSALEAQERELREKFEAEYGEQQ